MLVFAVGKRNDAGHGRLAGTVAHIDPLEVHATSYIVR